MNGGRASALSRFQDDFARALLLQEAGLDPEVAAIAAQPAFAIYRNGVMKSAIDALRANYPAVARLVGDEWFRAAAAVYVRTAPPSVPMLIEYGIDFPGFLARFEPAAELPYLADVARLERMWTEAHVGPTVAPLDPARVACLAPDCLERTVLRPHACARWAWFETAPIYTLWSRNRVDGDLDAEIDWCAEGALIVRPGDSVECVAVNNAACAFLDRCAAGQTLALAARAALDLDAQADLARIMCTLLAAGAFASIDSANDAPTQEERA